VQRTDFDVDTVPGDRASPSTEAALSDPVPLTRGRQILWSLSWLTVTIVLCIAAFFAVLAVGGAVSKYQKARSASAFDENPFVSTSVSLHLWRAIGFLLPLVLLIVLYLVAAWCVVAQRRKPALPATKWRRVVVGLAALSLVAVGLGIIAISLLATVSSTPDAWVVRAAGAVIGLAVAVSATYALVSPSFRAPILLWPIGLLLVILLAVMAIVANSSGGDGSDWVSSGFTSITWVAHGTNYQATDCTGAATCVAEGTVFAGKTATSISTDGGNSWTRHESVPPFQFFSWLSCWDADHCVGARGPMQITSNGGASWRLVKVPSTFTGWSVECRAPGFCIAVGSHFLPQPSAGVIVTHDGGMTWTQGSLPPGPWNLFNVACATASRCFATGTATRETASSGIILESNDGGASWTSAPIPSGVPLLSEISCGDANHCVAVGSSRTPGAPQSALAVWTSDGGVTWGRSSIASNDNVVRVACITSLECLAAGQGSRRLVLFDTTDGGVTWHASPARLPTETNLSRLSLGISCTHEGFCILVSATYAATSTDSGRTWKTVK
jgi:hypothetical protein